MFILEDYSVYLEDKPVLQNINLTIKPGETHVLFGPNGHGKSTLLNAIMGFPRFRVTGRCLYREQEVTGLKVFERAQAGIGLMFQRPPTIRGLKMRDLLKVAAAQARMPVEEMAAQMNMTDFLDRDINSGFSGGEIKRSELLQLLVQQPSLVLIDEPESGVDLENIELIGRAINQLLGKCIRENCGPECRRKHKYAPHNRASSLIITHTGHILNYVEADVGHVLYEGRLACTGNPREILASIKNKGYGECVRCLNNKTAEERNVHA